ncbi:voltage-gated potassium channel [Streptomyces sp. DvalAA-14]|uniref:potassium channel family protein n=1 Tax=unclassified Streptomyces TaxID=2593676 RepID=UPI00081BC032|nr:MULTISPECIES: potassium channel family protein [unclassified Streptomyces]MYS21223.1 two pore domain potassium channel family protein [Streptomyces sp. SID4948]SCD87184.1 voltage-gated potassium channel [Streptomyces sp. DvalAA-14]
MDADSRLSRWETRSELPLSMASLLFLGAYAVQVLDRGPAGPWRTLWLAVTFAIWAVFAADYAVRWWLDGHRPLPRYVRHHLLDTAVLLLPLLRPLRIIRLYDAVQRRRDRPRLSLYARVIAYAGSSAVLLGFAGALAVYQAERGAPGATIRTFGDSVWWTASTLTTVGYGDITPVTPLGRTLATGMMIAGLALLGAVTGAFSSWLIQVFTRDDERPPAG